MRIPPLAFQRLHLTTVTVQMKTQKLQALPNIQRSRDWVRIDHLLQGHTGEGLHDLASTCGGTGALRGHATGEDENAANQKLNAMLHGVRRNWVASKEQRSIILVISL